MRQLNVDVSDNLAACTSEKKEAQDAKDTSYHRANDAPLGKLIRVNSGEALGLIFARKGKDAKGITFLRHAMPRGRRFIRRLKIFLRHSIRYYLIHCLCFLTSVTCGKSCGNDSQFRVRNGIAIGINGCAVHYAFFRCVNASGETRDVASSAHGFLYLLRYLGNVHQ